MPVPRRAALLGALVSLVGALPSSVVAQAAFPNPPGQPIRLIVPFPPAGGTDVVSRLMADKVHGASGWNWVIENRPGAGGNIGLDALAKSKPDGYTLGMGQTANLAINPTLYPKMSYDAAKDFVPIAIVAAQPVILVVRTESPFKSVADVVAASKAKPASVSMASAGNGTVGHLAGESFARRASIKFVHVPYKGAGPAATDLLAGQVDIYFATPQTVVGFVKTGKLRALATTSARRLPVLPDTPTVAESGYAGFEATDWKMLVAPAGTPVDIVKRLHAEVDKAMSRPETIAQLLADGSVPMSGSPQQAAQFLKSEQQRWGTIVRDGKFSVD